jgi:hypothetical protein
VNAGGNLGGDGSVPATTVQSGGFLSPGDPLGIFTTGSLSLATGSTFMEQVGGISAGTQYDQTVISAGGTVALDSSALNISLLGGFLPTVGQQFTIINNQSGNSVIGTFSQGSTYILNGYIFGINYAGGAGHDVVLTVLGQTTTTLSASTTFGAPPTSSLYGQSVTFTATVTADAPATGTTMGKVTFLDGSTILGTDSLSNGIASLSISTLGVGSHTITASFTGTNGWLNSVASLTQKVSQDATMSKIITSAASVAVGQSVTFTATITADAPGSGTPTGTVTFLDGTTTLGTGALSGGNATFSTSSLSVGTHTITATYGGDTNFTGGPPSNTVLQTVGGTRTSVASSADPSVYGQKVTFTATVAALVSGSGIPTGTVTFFDGSTQLGTGAVNSTTGQATFMTTAFALDLGGNAITVSYGGSSNFIGSTSNVLTQTVDRDASTTTVTSSANPPVYGQKVIFTAAVTAQTPGSGTATGTVTFYDGNSILGTGTLNSGGTARLTTTAFALSPGGNFITVSYSGDSHFVGGASAALTQTVNQDATTSTIITSAATAVVGQSVTFTAAITANSPGSGVPTGSVTFYDGASVLGTGILNASGQATLSTGSLSPGGRSITASYGGDANYIASSSSALTETIDQAGTRTVVTSSASPAVFGQTVTFTATVAAEAPGSGVATGTVTFMDGTTTLGTGTLNGSGQATLATSSLTVGSQSITADYGGDANYIASTSNILPLTALVELVTSPAQGAPTGTPVTLNVQADSFVSRTYLDVLGRAVDPAGLQSWVNIIVGGGSFATVAQGILASAEHRTMQVNAYYESFLGRAADPAGLSHWLNQFAAGATEEAVELGILESGEFMNAHASNQSFLTALYLDLFNRAPDPSGFAAWSSFLQSGVARSVVISDFLACNEYRLDVIDAYYEQLLHRQADVAGAQHWLRLYDSGSTQDAIAVDLLTSSEYLNIR